MCGQSVHYRLSNLGKIKDKHIPAGTLEIIKRFYETGFKKGDGSLQKLADAIGMEKANLCRLARKMGLTSASRKMTKELSDSISQRVNAHIKKNGHPRGALGMKHSDEAKRTIARLNKERFAAMSPLERVEHARKAMLTKIERYGKTSIPQARGNWKSEWIEVGGKRFFSRSSWESIYARFLESMKTSGEILEWQYEPRVFIFDGELDTPKNYLPDFSINLKNGEVEYHEVKGWMCPRSIKSIERMEKHHPEITLKIIGAKWFRDHKEISE